MGLPDMSQKPKVTSRRRLFKTRIFEVEELHLHYANGSERVFERLRPRPDPQSVIVFPLLDEDTFLLVREYGAGLERHHLALPRGAIDEGEDILACANRELMEEAGYGAGSLTHVRRLALSPNYMGTVTEVVLARDLYEKRLPGDEPEPLEVVPWPLRDMGRLSVQEDCWGALTLSTLFIVREYLRREKEGGLA